MKLGRLEPVVSRLGRAAVRLLAATWRIRVVGGEHLDALRAARRPFVFVLWHSRILPLLYQHRHESIVLLISRHRDGGHLADLAESWGYRFVRGSSQRGGEIGLLGIVRNLQENAVVAITPDGPRGPAEVVKPGAVAAAQHAGAAILPIGATPHAMWRLKSWDRFCIPKPFSAIDVTYGAPILVGAGKDAIRRGIAEVTQSLRRVNPAA
ncbi:MAG TPA: lysophospholipid acyltransferase family protein [Gemmatimonadales bacterium]